MGWKLETKVRSLSAIEMQPVQTYGLEVYFVKERENERKMQPVQVCGLEVETAANLLILLDVTHTDIKIRIYGFNYNILAVKPVHICM